ncbi:MAG: DUF5690 family protein, partial [Pirellulales bacterium]
GNVGFLMYVADALGYLGYVAVLALRLTGVEGAGNLPFFVSLCWTGTALLAACTLGAWLFFARRTAAGPTAATESA